MMRLQVVRIRNYDEVQTLRASRGVSWARLQARCDVRSQLSDDRGLRGVRFGHHAARLRRCGAPAARRALRVVRACLRESPSHARSRPERV